MPVPYKFNILEIGPTPRKYAKEVKRINQNSARTLGRHFHKVNMPRRFTVGGGIMLGYAARSPEYQRNKLKLLGHQRPLEASGETKRAVLSREDIRTGGTSRKWSVHVVLNARQLNRFVSSRGVRPADEIRRVASKEEGPLVRVFEKDHVAQIAKIK